MTGSYKIALLAAALLCALVVGYYVMPASDEAGVGTDDAAEPAHEASEPRSLLRNGRATSAQRPGQPRASSDADEMTPFEESTSRGAWEAGEDDVPPPSEDPGMAAGYDDEPVLPVSRNGNSLQTNPFEPVDVADAADDQTNDQPAEEEASEPAPSRALIISGRRSEPQPEPEPDDEPEAAPSRETAQTGTETYTVQAGDTLSSIATDLYGAERHWVDIARANPRVDPIRLRIGQELRLPDRDAIEQRSRDDDLESPPGTLTHVVRPGETLSTIAQQHYNDSSRWRIIFNANRDLLGSDPDRVKAGHELAIPPLPRN